MSDSLPSILTWIGVTAMTIAVVIGVFVVTRWYLGSLGAAIAALAVLGAIIWGVGDSMKRDEGERSDEDGYAWEADDDS